LFTNPKFANRYSADELIVIGLVFSIFVSVYTAAAALVLFIAYLIKSGKIVQIVDLTDGAAYLVLFFPLAAVISISSANVIGLLTTVVLAGVFLISMFIRSIMTHRLFEAIVKASCAGSLISFLAIIWQLMTHIKSLGSYRPSATFLNANFYATMSVIVILFSLYQLTSTHHEKKGLLIMTIGVNLTGLYFCNCRSAIIALSAAVLVYLVLTRRYKAFGITAGMMLLLAGAIWLIPGLLPRTEEIGKDLAVRESIWRTAVYGIMKHPFFGQGGFAYLLTSKLAGGPAVNHAHSLFLDFILNYGFVGTALLVLYFRENLKPLRSMVQDVQDRQKSCLTVAVITAMLIHGITDVTVLGMQTGLFLAVIMAFPGLEENKKAAAYYPLDIKVKVMKSVLADNRLPVRIGRQTGLQNPVFDHLDYMTNRSGKAKR
jgi:O-antigen ligase